MRLPSRLLIIVAAGMLLGLTMLGATDRLPGAAAGVDAQDEARNTVMLPFVPASDTPTEILLPTPTSTVAPTPTSEDTPAATPTPTWTAPATIPPTPTLPPPTPPIGTVYYLAPAGNDGRAGTSPATAWATFDRAWESLFPGDVLVLLDGVYHQSLAPGVRDGEPGAPITIRAAHDGQAVIDGDFVRVPVQLGPWPGATRDYFVIEGIVARNSSDHVYDINGSHNVLRRVSGYNANRDANSHVFILTGTDTLLEDCIASGTGRKMAFTWGGQRNIIRRCFTNWQRYDGREFNSDWPWGEDLEFYNSSDSIMENSISYGSPPKTAVSVYGNIDSANGSTPYSVNDKVLGVMVVRNGVYTDGTFWEWPLTRPQPTDNDVIAKIHEWAGWRLGFGVILWGEAAEVKDIPFQATAWRSCGLGLAEIHPFNRSENVTVNRATIIENGLTPSWAKAVPAPTWTRPDQKHYAITDAHRRHGAPGRRRPTRVHRYVDGVLMDGSNGRPAPPPGLAWRHSADRTGHRPDRRDDDDLAAGRRAHGDERARADHGAHAAAGQCHRPDRADDLSGAGPGDAGVPGAGRRDPLHHRRPRPGRKRAALHRPFHGGDQRHCQGQNLCERRGQSRRLGLLQDRAGPDECAACGECGAAALRLPVGADHVADQRDRPLRYGRGPDLRHE
ncbi:MAG: hypothetical protein R2851_20070 [Caldilineaceae bacterium]